MSGATFSYAQAAKGHTVAQPSSQPASSQAKDDLSVTNSSVTAPSVASNDAESQDAGKNAKSDVEAGVSRPESEITSVGGSSASATSADQSVKPSRETEAAPVDSRQQHDEKASRSASRTSRSNDGPDARKGRKGKKPRNADKEAQNEPQPEEEKEKEKVVLSEAPVPTVNPWLKRQEERAKLAPPTPAVPKTSSPAKSQSPEDGDAQSTTVGGATKEKSQKKGPEPSRNAEQGQRRSAPRGTRANDKDGKLASSLPSVEDTSAWPDPKSAATADVAPQKPEVRAEPAERESREETGKSKKSWEKLEVQHSVIFQTALPTTRTPRPRGGGRGGRESGSSRDNQSSNADAVNASAQSALNDKPASTNGTGVTKSAASQPRENGIPARPAPQAGSAPSKRPSVDGPVSKDQRKTSVSTHGDQGRESGPDVSAPIRKGKAPQTDARLDSGPSSARPASKAAEVGKDGAHSTSQPYVREGRPDRGRGGVYRGGRGGHNGATGQHLPQSSYAQNGQYNNVSSYQQRQNSAAHSPPHSGQFQPYGQSRGRGGNRWNSQPSGRTNSNGGGAGAVYAPRLAPQTGDLPVQPPYPSFPSYPPPVMFPDMFLLMKGQLEYYFSVDNLIKDLFFRGHMNCQGFVELDVIADFKRMKSMIQATNLDLLRYVCANTDSVEFVIGEDQKERVRSRKHWKTFLVPAEERITELQHDNPIKFTPYPAPVTHLPSASVAYSPIPHQYAVGSPVAATYPVFPEGAGFQPGYINGAQYEQPTVNGAGLNGHHYGYETQLSAGVPEFAPAHAPSVAPEVTAEKPASVEPAEKISDSLEAGTAA